MSDPDRDNADLRAKLAEAQTDKKFADVLGEFRTSQADMNGKIDRLVDSIGRLGDDVKESRSDNKFTRWTIAGLAVGMFGVVIALVALMLTFQGTMTTANGNLIAALKAEPAAATATAPPAPETK